MNLCYSVYDSLHFALKKFLKLHVRDIANSPLADRDLE